MKRSCYSTRNISLVICFSVLLLGVIISSCHKEHTPDPANETTLAAGNKIYSAMASVYGEQEKKNAYTTLSDVERFQFWQFKLYHAILKGGLSNDQAAKVKEVMTALTLAYFKAGEEREIFKTYFLPDWLEKSKTTFTPLEVYDLLFDLNPYHSAITGNSDATPQVKLRDADCKCAVGPGIGRPVQRM